MPKNLVSLNAENYFYDMENNVIQKIWRFTFEFLFNTNLVF